MPPADQITPTTPLRLPVAAELAFPDGSVSGKALQREAAKGKLEIIRIAGKHFTTLEAIERMCKQCRVQPSHPVSISASAPVENPCTSSSTVDVKLARDAARTKLETRKARRKSAGGGGQKCLADHFA
jgi:hypothetical protein